MAEININQEVGKYFKLKHLIYSTAARNNSINNMPGIDGSPSQSEIINNLKLLMNNVVDKIIDIPRYSNLVITSGYRCLELNKLLGGSNTSQHIYGQAVDIRIPGLPTRELYNYIYENLSWDQLIWEYPEKEDNSWVHISYGPQNRSKTTLVSSEDIYHNLYNGERFGSSNQYQHGITDAKIV